jgi:hypothetical protein
LVLEPVVTGGGCCGSLGFTGVFDVGSVSGAFVVAGPFVVIGSAGTLVFVDAGGAGPGPPILIVVVAWSVNPVTGTCTLGSPDPLGIEQVLMPGNFSVMVGSFWIQKSRSSVPGGGFAYASCVVLEIGGSSTYPNAADIPVGPAGNPLVEWQSKPVDELVHVPKNTPTLKTSTNGVGEATSVFGIDASVSVPSKVIL